VISTRVIVVGSSGRSWSRMWVLTRDGLALVVEGAGGALDGILVNAADPGLTGTDFNGNRGIQTVTEGTGAIVRLATLPKDGPTGTFQDRYGIVPW
jgi:hypothetical protein